LLRHKIPTDKPVIGFVGRLSPEKNIGAIIQCAKALKDYSFVFVGDGPQKEHLINLTGVLNNVYFVGNQTNVEDYYVAFDLLILSSLTEGLPLVIVEAMTCGTPVVSSNVGGINEILFDGLNGKLINNPNDNSSYINAINSIIGDQKEWNKLSNSARNFALKIKEAGDKVNLDKVYKMILYSGGKK
jgi:glycosyltransferase involved in cell wall biosynthesis